MILTVLLCGFFFCSGLAVAYFDAARTLSQLSRETRIPAEIRLRLFSVVIRREQQS